MEKSGIEDCGFIAGCCCIFIYLMDAVSVVIVSCLWTMARVYCSHWKESLLCLDFG